MMFQKILVAGVLLFIQFCELSSCMQLDIVKVGQANFTILKVGNKALIYDCGSMDGSWTSDGKFKIEKLRMFNNLLPAEITKVGIVISHEDKDHTNLLPAVRNALGKRNCFEISRNKGMMADELKQLSTFFDIEESGGEEIDDPKFKCLLLIPNITSNNNDSSAVLKVTWNDGLYAFLMTGDATGKTLSTIQGENIRFYGDVDNQRQLSNAARNLFENVVGFMPAHHGSATEDSLTWSYEVLNKSRFPVLTVISSDPSKSNCIPKLETIRLLSEWSSSNLKGSSADYVCVPHVIDCSYQAIAVTDENLKNLVCDIPTVVKYPSKSGDCIVPIFVTSNLTSEFYRICLGRDFVQLCDNKKILYMCDLQVLKGPNPSVLSVISSFLMTKFIEKRLRDIKKQLEDASSMLVQHLICLKNVFSTEDHKGSVVENTLLPATCKLGALWYLQKMYEVLYGLHNASASTCEGIDQIFELCQDLELYNQALSMTDYYYSYLEQNTNPHQILVEFGIINPLCGSPL